jgi:hypothetical protein
VNVAKSNKSVAMMGTRAFVARHGWKDTPIRLEEWAEAVQQSADLELHQSPDGELTALLRGSRRRRVTWHDGYLASHHTDARLAVAVFALAERLHADVYSERRYRYASLAEWQQRAAVPTAHRDNVLSFSPTLASNSAGWVAWVAVAVGFAFLVMAN